MKVLFITQYYPPEVEPGGYRVHDFAKELVKEGHEVCVATGMPNFPTGKKLKPYRRRLLKMEEIEGINILRTYVWARLNRGFANRMLNYLSFVISSVIVQAFTGKFDAVVATSPPLSTGFSGYVISRIKRTPFIFEVRDLWPESMVTLGLIKSDGALCHMLEKLERFIYRHSDRIIVVTEGFGTTLVAGGISAKKIDVIPSGSDTNLIKPCAEDNSLRGRLNKYGKSIVLYAGNHGFSQGLEALIEAASILRSHRDILFLLVGEGSEKQKLLELANNLRIDNVTFLPEQPRAEMNRFYAAADILVVLLKKNPVFLKTVPSKLYESMATGKPIVLGVDGEAHQILNRAKAGIFVEPGNPSAIANAILALHDDDVLRLELGRNGRDYVGKHYSRQVLAKKYESVLRSIVAGSNAV